MNIKNSHCQTRLPLKQSGIGLIEILIAVILLSIGFLAAAQMQVRSMRFSQSAYHQSQAYFMASDMIDRMRSNATAVNSGLYTDRTTSASPINPKCRSNTCGSAQLVEQDIYDWSAKLHSLQAATNFVPTLPSVDGIAAYGKIDHLGEGVYQVTLSWGEDIEGKAEKQSLSVNFVSETQR